MHVMSVEYLLSRRPGPAGRLPRSSPLLWGAPADRLHNKLRLRKEPCVAGYALPLPPAMSAPSRRTFLTSTLPLARCPCGMVPRLRSMPLSSAPSPGPAPHGLARTPALRPPCRMQPDANGAKPTPNSTVPHVRGSS